MVRLDGYDKRVSRTVIAFPYRTTRLSDGHVLDRSETMMLLLMMISVTRRLVNSTIMLNNGVRTEPAYDSRCSRFTTAASRGLLTPRLPSEVRQSSRVLEVVRSTAWDAIKAVDARNRVVRAFEVLGWDATDDDVRLFTGYNVKGPLIRNIRESRSEQSSPLLRNGVIRLSKADNQLSVLKVNRRSTILTVYLWDDEYEFRFKNPKKLRHAEDTDPHHEHHKVCKPSIAVDGRTGEARFFFTIQSTVSMEPVTRTNTVTGFDLNSVFSSEHVLAGARVHLNGSYSRELGASVQTQALARRVSVLINQLQCLVNRTHKAPAWAVTPRRATARELEAKRLRNRIRNCMKSLALAIAHDALAHHLPESLTVFEDLRWSNGWTGWEHGLLRQAITDVFEAAGARVVFRTPAHTSTTCPRCGTQHTVHNRVITCECGWSSNKDYASGLNLARQELARLNKKRAEHRASIIRKNGGSPRTGYEALLHHQEAKDPRCKVKNHPTPRRPRPLGAHHHDYSGLMVTRTVPVSTGTTGVIALLPTGNSENTGIIDDHSIKQAHSGLPNPC